MKKKYIIALLVVAAIIMMLNTAGAADPPKTISTRKPLFYITQKHTEAVLKAPVSRLPSSLTEIEDSAFEGTALGKVELPKSVTSIGDYAFANISTLVNIQIPTATKAIGLNSFMGSIRVSITGGAGGYARRWAMEHDIPFTPIAGYYAFNVTITGIPIQNETEKPQKLISGDSAASERKANPTGRMTGEIKADQYESIAAFHIQGRSPPVC